MNSNDGGLPSSDRHESAAEIARKKVLAVYSSAVESLKKLPNRKNNENNNEYIAPPVPGAIYSEPTPEQNPDLIDQPSDGSAYPSAPSASYDTDASSQPSSNGHYDNYSANANVSYSEPATPNQTYYDQNYNQGYYQTTEPARPVESAPDYQYTDTTSSLKDAPINQTAVSDEWQQYHSAWQNYYQNYYSDYYAKAAQNYLATEKLKNERIASGQARRERHTKRLAPIIVAVIIALVLVFLQYNRLIFAPLMAYVSPDTGSVSTSIEAVDPNITQAVSPEPRLLIPKLNIDVPVAFNINSNDVMEAMNHGVAQFMIPGANALPGQIGNLVLSGHSAGDIYSSNPYKFIFSGLERLEPGDLIYINFESVRYTYQMTKSEVVEPTNVAALIYETDKPMLTLITCTPLGTSRFRLLVTAEQIAPEYQPKDPDAEPEPGDTPSADDNMSMPSNEPSFFESIWNGLFGS